MAVKNNHTVPQFYLRQWSDDGRSVWCYDKVSNRVYSAPVSKVAAERYFYLSSDGDYLEKKLASLEAGICPVLNKVREQKSYANLTPDEEHTLSFAVALQLVRTLFHRRDYVQMGMILHRWLKENGDHSSPNLKHFMLDSSEEEYKNKLKDESIHSLLPIALELYPWLLNKTWLIGLSDSEELLTSDTPVVKQNDTPPRRTYLPDGGYLEDPTTGSLGVASLGIVIDYPISPNLMLSFGCPAIYGCLSTPAGLHIKMEAENVLRANSLQLSYAERFVFARTQKAAEWAYNFAQEHPNTIKKHMQPVMLGDKRLDEIYGKDL